ncbi:hypothetical protein ACPV4B_01045 [Vibrio parahaemolyticus]|uniref:hypothetical protein n=1 Tax=Vibrio mediterranei TaxID=689 RepID=UPI0040690475
MPVAVCFITSELKLRESQTPDMVEVWSRHSGIGASEMTVTLIPSEQHFGKSYAVIGHLYLPSVWAEEQVTSLQLGLASALVDCFAIDESQVLIMTSMIESGLVVEGGREIHW